MEEKGRSEKEGEEGRDGPETEETPDVLLLCIVVSSYGTVVSGCRCLSRFLAP